MQQRHQSPAHSAADASPAIADEREVLDFVREPLAVSNYGIVTVVEFDGALSLPNESTLLTM